MDFNNMVDSHRSQIRFYQLSCLALIAVTGILAVIVPSALKAGPYVIQESSAGSNLVQSEPWKLTVTRVEGFLKLYLSTRLEWSKDNFDAKKDALKSIVSDTVFGKLKDSIVAYGSIAKSQDARGFYLLEGFRFSNEKHVIEAQISRIIRVGNTGVVTPLRLQLVYEDAPVSEINPYGLRIKSVEEGELDPPSRSNQ